MQLDFTNKPRLAKAHALADYWHQNVPRKYTGLPYITHPVAVAELLLSHGFHAEDMLCAALLHDVLEDTDCPPHHIKDACGERVLRWVTLLSDMETGNRATRKELSRQRLSAAPAEVQTIKVCDLIDNTRSIVEHDPKFAKVYLPEKKALLDVLTLAPAGIKAIAYDIYSKGLMTLAEGELKMALAHQGEVDEIEAILIERDLAPLALF